MSDLNSSREWHTSTVKACCLGTLTQQILKHLLNTNTYIQQQVYGQLLFQEDRLILKHSLIAFNIVEN